MMQEPVTVQEMVALVLLPGMQLSDVAVNLLMYRYTDSDGFIPFRSRMDRMMSE